MTEKKCRHQVAGDFGLGHLQLAIAGFSGARPSGSGNFPTVEDFVLHIFPNGDFLPTIYSPIIYYFILFLVYNYYYFVYSKWFDIGLITRG